MKGELKMDIREARVRINVATGEFEVEGSEAFVREFQADFQDLLERVGSGVIVPAGAEDEPVALATDHPDTAKDTMPPSFGEYYTRFPSTMSDIDKVLVAAHFAQAQSADRTFSTREVNKLLKLQGVKVANAAWCVTQHKAKKRVFAVSKGRFRVSEDGHAYIVGKMPK